MTKASDNRFSRRDDKNGEILFEPGQGVYFAKSKDQRLKKKEKKLPLCNSVSLWQ
jgi:hypothetical protein